MSEIKDTLFRIDTKGDPTLLNRFESDNSNNMSIEFIINNLDYLKRKGCIGTTWEGHVIDVYIAYNKPKYLTRLVKFIQAYIYAIKSITLMTSNKKFNGPCDVTLMNLKTRLRRLLKDETLKDYKRMVSEIQMNKDIYIFIRNYIKKLIEIKYVNQIFETALRNDK